VRNGMSVTPVIGASSTGSATKTGPMAIGLSAGGWGSVVMSGTMPKIWAGA